MTLNKIDAVMSSGRLEEAHAWYSRLFDRPADLHLMASVYEWHFGNGGMQLVNDATRAGSSMLTVIVPDLDRLRAALEARQLALGPTPDGDFARLAQIADSDGKSDHLRAAWSDAQDVVGRAVFFRGEPGPQARRKRQPMAELFLQISISLDGYIEDRDHDIAWM